MGMNGTIHAPAALLQEKELLVPIGWEAEWAPKPVWTRWRTEKISASAGNRTTVIHPVADSLYSLSYPGSNVIHFANLNSCVAFIPCTEDAKQFTSFVLLILS
jgi:hypothetical protein